MLRGGAGGAGPRGLRTVRGLLWLAVLLGAQSSAKKAGGASLGRVGSGEQQDLQSLSSQTLPTVAIYRLIGNDMPPLQQIGQLRWNTQYAMDYEVDFPGARKRWILNRIWNDTEFRAVYSGLIADGVHRRDILLRCFDLDTYATILDEQDKMLYLTSQNEGRNAGILDGRESGFEWSMILDGNTFITNDSWSSLSKMFRNASQMGLRYVKIPYHRLHIAQTPSFLTGTTSMRESLLEAPIKGESQIAFHKLAPELFTLGDTKPGESEKSKVSRFFALWSRARLGDADTPPPHPPHPTPYSPSRDAVTGSATSRTCSKTGRFAGATATFVFAPRCPRATRSSSSRG